MHVCMCVCARVCVCVCVSAVGVCVNWLAGWIDGPAAAWVRDLVFVQIGFVGGDTFTLQ